MCLYAIPISLDPLSHGLITHRHIIAPLRIMSIQPLPTALVLWHNAVQRIAHVGAHIVVVVLVQAQRARCVLDEEVDEAGLVRLDLRKLFDDVVGDEVGAARARGEGEGFLEPSRTH
jgi:hypothetical protein